LTWYDDNAIAPYAAPCNECFNHHYHFAGCKFYKWRHHNEWLDPWEEKTDHDFFVEEADERKRIPEIRIYAAGD
jgi:hypothetical protein